MDKNITQHPPLPIAIIGIGSIFAKSPDLKSFFHMLIRGINGISDPPATHRHLIDYLDADPKKPDHIYCNRGGFLPPVPFDPTEFNIPPNVIEATDTSQLLGLITAKSALEDAGYGETGKPFDRDKVSVLLGVTGTQELVIPLGARLGHPLWKKALAQCGVPQEQADKVIQYISDGYVGWQENSFPGLLGNVVAGRIANRLDLGGTNCVVDAACASSMGAIHLALLELRSGRSDMVITGGVDTLNDAFMHMCFSKTQILSASGDVRPFSAEADGTVLGEGVGLVVLKRLQDAINDGDRVYAVIKGMGAASDGRSQSIYAPNPKGQAKALRRAYQEAGVAPSTVALLEAHGTGTRVGDQVEFKALCNVFGEKSPNGNRCALGSVKSNIGHTKAAAGTAGLIKAALSVYHKVLPPTLKAESPDPKLGVEDSPFYINTQLRPWLNPKDEKRKAGISAFGFGGSNFHAVLEEFDSEKTEPAWDGTIEIAAFSGIDKTDLAQKITSWSQNASQNRNRRSVGELCRQSRNTFKASNHERLVMVLNLDSGLEHIDRICQDAVTRLEKEGNNGSGSAIFTGSGPAPGKLAFLFPGQGSQYVGMGRDIICCFPESFKAFSNAAAFFKGERPLDDYLFPRLPIDHGQLESDLRQTQIAQPAIGGVSVAMLKALNYFSILPDMTCGHSFGELVALYAAGWMKQSNLWELAVERGRLMAAAGATMQETGTMMAVRAPIEELQVLVDNMTVPIVLANRNSLEQGVLSGSLAAIETAEHLCREKGWRSLRLPVSAAFHSHLVADAQKPFSDQVRTIEFTPTPVPVSSNTSGGTYPTRPDAIQPLLSGQLAAPVDFVSNIRNLYELGARTFIEIGPKAVLTQLVRSILSGMDFTAVALDKSTGPGAGITDLAATLAQLAAIGYNVQLERWEKPQSKNRTARMTIPLSGANYRSPRKEKKQVVDTAPKAVLKKVRVPEPGPVVHHEHKGTVTAQGVLPVPSPNMTTPASTQNKMNDHSKTSMQNAFSAVQQGLASLQALQEQTTQAHQKYLETQAEASRTLQMMIQSTQQLTASTLAGNASGSASAEIRPALTQPIQQPVLQTVSTTPEKSVAIPEQPVPQPKAKALPSAPAAASIQPAVADDTPSEIQKNLLSVVSQLTGYPVDMLGLEMDIESDLGIDSIKRVEILSAVEEKMPGLPQVTPDMMGTLKTLGQICAYLSSSDSQQSKGGENTIPPQSTVGGSSPQRQNIQTTLVEIVSQLTGYPVDMLGLEMDIESDLGIDSIKRVEILSALEEKMPDLPQVTPDLMGSLKTIGQICDYLCTDLGAGPQPDCVSAVDNSQPSPGPAGQGPIQETLIEIVSQLTGYPPDMLGLDLDIESDLGVDSIKRVEILSALEEKMPDLPKVTPDLMGTLKSLGQIIEYLAGTTNPNADRPAKRYAVALSDDSAPSFKEPELEKESQSIDRQIIEIHSLKKPSGPQWVIPQNHFIGIVDTTGNLPQALSTALNNMGLATSLLVRRDQLTSDLPLAGLVLPAPIAPIEAFLWAQAAEPLLNKIPGTCLVTISALDGAFGFRSNDIRAPEQGALAGLAKTAAIEWPEIRCLALDVDPDWQDTSAVAEALAEEIGQSCAHTDSEIGLSAIGRIGLRMTPAALPATKPINLEQDDVVLITGGGRGVTAAAAIALAERSNCTTVLVGRSPVPTPEPDWLSPLKDEGQMKKAIIAHQFPDQTPSPMAVEKAFRTWSANRAIQATLEALFRSGSKAHYFSVDVNDKNAVQALVQEINHKIGPVKALIHGAGVLEDRLIVDKQHQQFDRVYSTKVKGLYNLLETLQMDNLAYLVLFSSVSARLGNQGQVDYAMANEVLNKVAHQQAHQWPQCKVLSINWGPWDGGMVTPSLKRNFIKNDIPLIPLNLGAIAMVDEMAVDGKNGVEVVIGGSLHPIGATTVSVQLPSLNVDTIMPLALTCRREIDVERHPVLRSHLLDGRPVVPLALMTEWLAHSALHANPGLMLYGMDNIRLYNGIKLDQQKRIVQMLAGKALRNDGVFKVDVEIREDNQEGLERVHSSATVILADQLPAAPLFEENGHFKTNGSIPSLESIYKNILFHGHDLHGIQEIISLSPKGITAKLASAPPPVNWMKEPLRSRWIADPLVLDCAFQMAIIWSHENQGRVSLPSFAASYRQYCTQFPPNGISAVLEVHTCTDRKLVGDFTFLDERKRVLARLQGYEAIITPDLHKAFKAA